MDSDSYQKKSEKVGDYRNLWLEDAQNWRIYGIFV